MKATAASTKVVSELKYFATGASSRRLRSCMTKRVGRGPCSKRGTPASILDHRKYGEFLGIKDGIGTATVLYVVGVSMTDPGV